MGTWFLDFEEGPLATQSLDWRSMVSSWLESWFLLIVGRKVVLAGVGETGCENVFLNPALLLACYTVHDAVVTREQRESRSKGHFLPSKCFLSADDREENLASHD